MKTKSKLLYVFLISTLMLTLQLLQTRIFSVIYWNHLVYFIITMALLGLAVGGTVLSLSSRIRSADERSFFSLCLAGFSVSALLGTYGITNLSGNFFLFWESPTNILNLVLSYILAMIPFFFFGLFIANVFLKNPERSGIIYFSNLFGSAAGCLLYIILIKPLGAINLLIVIFVIGSIAGIFSQKRRRLSKIVLQSLCVVIMSYMVASTIQILPEINKSFRTFKDRKVEFSQWNAISRIDVASRKGVRNKAIFIDGGAPTPLIKTDPGVVEDRTGIRSTSLHREAAYVLFQNRELDNVLVIGSGGGADVLTAYKNNAGMIDAVEINPTTAEIVTDQFASFIGNIFKAKNVKLHVEDGRSFVRRSGKLYDVIMIFAVDSFTALSSGAYVMSESYLYTTEAISDYWDHLDKEGILQISRWYYSDAPREILRVFITAYEALSKRGVDPSRHMLVVGDKAGSIPFADVLISRKPFQKEDILEIQNWLGQHTERRNWLGQYPNMRLIYNPLADYSSNSYSNSMDNPFYAFAAAFKTGSAEEFFEDYQFNVRPSTDDNPFFFQYGRWSHAFRPYPMGPGRFESVHGRWPFLVILALTLQSILLVAFLVWLPVLRLKRKRNTEKGRHLPIIFYFSLLGLGFMFIEIALIQKIVLLLGHPIYSMVVTIPTILIAAGTGSICSGLIKPKTERPLLLTVLGICFFIFIWIIAGPGISRTLLPYPTITKSIAVAALIFPLGFLMGIPFPMGIRRLSDFPRMIPIAWAANGGMSVIGSIVAVIIAMTTGFSYVFVIAAALYIMALLCFSVWEKKENLGTSPQLE